jgi:hypothetical protein
MKIYDFTSKHSQLHFDLKIITINAFWVENVAGRPWKIDYAKTSYNIVSTY